MTNTASPFIQLLASWDAWAVTGLLVLGLPSFAYFGLYKGARSQNYFGRLSKVGTHLWISGALWFTLLALVIVAARHGLSLADMGISWANPMRQIATTVVVLALLSTMTLLDFRKHQRMSPDALGKKLATVQHIFPSNRAEMTSFVIMAMSAGICEELMYRGWLMNLMDVATGSVWIGLLLSSVAFGLGHAYQGPQGMIGTGVVGLVLGLLYMWLGSLVPVQIIHAFVNLSSGFMCVWLMRVVSAPAFQTAPQSST